MSALSKTSEHRTPVSLILRLRDGTDEEWRTFWEIYGPVIYRLARRGGLNHHDAQDVVCEVMRGLHAKIRRGLELDHQKGRFRGYVARSVARATARFRERFHDPRSGPGRGMADGDRDALIPAPADEEIAALERGELIRVCLARLQALPEVRRRDFEAFEQYVIEDQPADRVAKRYGISRGRLYGIRNEMINRLRSMISELDQDLGEGR